MSRFVTLGAAVLMGVLILCASWLTRTIMAGRQSVDHRENEMARRLSEVDPSFAWVRVADNDVINGEPSAAFIRYAMGTSAIGLSRPAIVVHCRSGSAPRLVVRAEGVLRDGRVTYRLDDGPIWEDSWQEQSTAMVATDLDLPGSGSITSSRSLRIRMNGLDRVYEYMFATNGLERALVGEKLCDFDFIRARSRRARLANERESRRVQQAEEDVVAAEDRARQHCEQQIPGADTPLYAVSSECTRFYYSITAERRRQTTAPQ